MIDMDPKPYVKFWSSARRARHNRLAAELISAGWREVDALRLATHQLITEEAEGVRPVPERCPDLAITL